MNKNDKLTNEQQLLVLGNQHLVEIVIKNYIYMNHKDPGYSYEDLYQVGCLGLCIAAQKYDNKRGEFGSFAMLLIRQQILRYLQHINPHQKVQPLEDDEDNGGPSILEFLSSDGNPCEAAENRDVFQVLQNLKQNYSGVVLKGIEAIELMLIGFSGADIARLYKVKPNHVSAWIARAKQKLRTDDYFLRQFR